MPDPTIHELVARLRELNKYATRAPWKADSGYNGGGISTAFFHIPGYNGGATVEMIEVDALLLLELRNNLPTILDALERGTDALARAWEEGAEAAFEAQNPGPDSDYIRPLFGRALDEFYASNPYRLAHVATSADPEVVRMAEFEVSRGPVTDGVSDPWLPIEECGELEGGKEYLVRMKRGKLDELITELITIARWSGAEWQVRIGDAERYYYRAEHITHVHRMGPIRGPGEG